MICVPVLPPVPISSGMKNVRATTAWSSSSNARSTDPVYASNAFYDVLIKIDGYRDMEITKVAQRVQRSAFPEAYADHEPEGRVLASALTGYSPAALTCRLDPKSRPSGAAASRLSARYWSGVDQAVE